MTPLVNFLGARQLGSASVKPHASKPLRVPGSVEVPVANSMSQLHAAIW